MSMDLALELSGSPFTVGVVEKEPATNPQETPNTDLGPLLISVCVPKSGGPSASRQCLVPGLPLYLFLFLSCFFYFLIKPYFAIVTLLVSEFT